MIRCRTVWLALLCLVCAVPLWAANETDGRNPINPLDQGGETCATAVAITSIPFCDTGTTLGHINDYPVPCNSNSAAPDVVYSITPPVTAILSFSLCGSAYNSALTIWRGCPSAGGVLVCCSDNVCGDDACCAGVTLQANVLYFVVVDGGAAPNAGNYLFNVLQGEQCPETPCAQDTCTLGNRDIEPVNNNCGPNTPNITCGDSLCGEISMTADRDWYRLNFTQFPCADIRIAVYGNDTPGHYPFGLGLNPKVSLWSADCLTMLAQDSDGGIGLDALLDSLCLPAGSYNVLVEHEGSIGPYELWVWCTPCECACPWPSEDIEPNNVCSGGGGVILCGDTVCGYQELGANDYYYFEIFNTCQNVTIDVFGNDTPGQFPFGQGLNPRVTLYEFIGCNFVAFDDNSGVGEDARIDSLCLEPGIYRLHVAAEPQATNFGPYVIATSCSPCPCDTCPYPNQDIEPINNQCGTFNPILRCGDNVCGEIVSVVAPDQDWYVIQITDGCRELYIDILGNDTGGYYPFGHGLNPAGELWSADCGTLLYQDFNSGAGEDARITTDCLEPGFYMLRIYGELATQGPYIVLIACQSCACPAPCEVTCPQGALLENEPCPSLVDTTNGGCAADEQLFLPLGCGQVYCGTSIAFLGGYVDTDWYRLLVPQPSQVRLCVSSEFDGYLSLYVRGPGTDPCDQRDLVDCEFIAGCQGAQCISMCLPAGIYFAEFKPTGFQAVECWDYVLAAVCSACEPTVCEAPDSLVISYPDSLNPDDPITDVTLRWPPVPGATEYRVYRTSDNNSVLIPTPVTYVATTLDTFFVHDGVIVNDGTNEIWIYYVLSYCEYTHEPCDVVPTAIEPARVLPMRREE
ncbi:MAG: hypothetical protein IPG71_04310 [bacterium]|nr:hypothetical protein [bacterium]